MRNVFLQFLLSFLGSLILLATTPAVEEAFKEKYPEVQAPRWKSEDNGSWRAQFEQNNIKYRAYFDAGGNWVETEHDTTYSNLPVEVRSAIELKYDPNDIRDIEAVESPTHGYFYDVEFQQGSEKVDVMFDIQGNILDPATPPTEKGFLQQWMQESTPNSAIMRSSSVLIYKFFFNLFTIFLYAYVIYYRRHHDHKMLFLLLAFNLFLFPIFLSSSLVTAGFGFTIFALLALVRLRSAPFDKAEISYLLGAISLTFVNTMLPAFIDIPAAALILLTVYFADRPSLWRDSYQRIEVDYRMVEREKMLDQAYLRERLSEELVIEVREVAINRILKSEVKLTLMYRDLTPEEREERAVVQQKERALIEEEARLASLAKKQETAALTEKARLEEEMKMRTAMAENGSSSDTTKG